MGSTMMPDLTAGHPLDLPWSQSLLWPRRSSAALNRGSSQWPSGRRDTTINCDNDMTAASPAPRLFAEPGGCQTAKDSLDSVRAVAPRGAALRAVFEATRGGPLFLGAVSVSPMAARRTRHLIIGG